MELLLQRELNPQLTSHRTMLDVGGLWCAPFGGDTDELVKEARTKGVRALEYLRFDLDFLAQLPDIEVLMLLGVNNPEVLYTLPKLRHLHISGDWDGRIDFQRLPNLEYFAVVECPRDEGGLETLYAGHPRLKELHIQRYRREDLTPFRDLPLETLYLGYSRSMTSLYGADRLGRTLRKLGLYACSNLPALDGISLLRGLESLELGSLRHVTTLEFAQELPRLRNLDLFELANVESLWPLAGHPAIEFLMFGRVRDKDLTPLTQLPRLRLYLGGTPRWQGVSEDLPHLNSLPDDDPAIWDWRWLQIL